MTQAEVEQAIRDEEAMLEQTSRLLEAGRHLDAWPRELRRVLCLALRDETVVQPDVLVVCDPSKLDEAGVRGAPDWVVEVLSPSTAGQDHIVKRRLYEEHGVPKLWLVHPTGRVVMIFRLVDGAYGASEVQELQGETAVGSVPGLVIRWEPILRRLC